MNLTELIRKNDIKCKDGQEFSHNRQFLKMKRFEKTCHTIYGVPFPKPETHEVGEFEVRLSGVVVERWDTREKKTKRWFFVNRSFRYPDLPEDIDTVEDAATAGKTVDEAIESLEAERQRFDFFKQYDLIDAGRYWVNRDLQRYLVDEGKVAVID